LVWVSWKSIRNLPKPDLNQARELTNWALIGLVGSWFAWYLALGMYWDRYLFPATFVGSLFASVLLDHFTSHFNWRKTIREIGLIIPHKHDPAVIPHNLFNGIGSLFIVLWVSLEVLFTIFLLLFFYFPLVKVSASEVANYINTHTLPEARIETYESELFFFLGRRYHYPPDQVHVQLIRRKLIDPLTSIAYDPLLADPDYLIIGRYSTEWRLYDPWIQSGDFRLLKLFPGYAIYERVRSP
jgi:hypothetical protein